MKHIFVINPVAGKGMGREFAHSIEDVAEELDINYEIYFTTKRYDAEKRVREICSENEVEKKEKNIENIRFYACGGDGTLNEVANGICGFKKVELACIPIGSGNDFVKNFPKADFMSIERQILGEVQKVDLMEYSGIFDGVFMKKVAINMFNIGFDANVANDMNVFKAKPLITGKGAYRISLATNFIAKKGGDLVVNIDNKEIHSGKLFFVNICNGSFLGGGMKGAPFARVDDGKMDINIVKNMSRVEFLKLISKYMKGTHMSVPGIEKTITYMQTDDIEIVSNDEKYRLGVDGEIIEATGTLRFRMLPKAVDFAIPLNK